MWEAACLRIASAGYPYEAVFGRRGYDPAVHGQSRSSIAIESGDSEYIHCQDRPTAALFAKTLLVTTST